ncbi:hypothetical protein CDAR_201231 [Caerostris darwini]|uniref:Uncharacterized protein n=1 Tax=Caerostris darwini TaxID=1538125 RepID=A0AAV4P3A6_9ARAC|nr:hypothetical protein CDAR_201231 [Caerostris darwini]
MSKVYSEVTPWDNHLPRTVPKNLTQQINHSCQLSSYLAASTERIVSGQTVYKRLYKYLPLDFGGSCCRDEKASKTAQKVELSKVFYIDKESLKDDTEKPFDCLLRSLTDIQVQHHTNFEACNAKKGIPKRKGVKRKNIDSNFDLLAQNLTKKFTSGVTTSAEAVKEVERMTKNLFDKIVGGATKSFRNKKRLTIQNLQIEIELSLPSKLAKEMTRIANLKVGKNVS